MATISNGPAAPPPRKRLPGEPPALSDFLDALHLRRRFLTARTSSRTLLRCINWLRDVRGVDALAATSADVDAYRTYLAADYRTPDGKAMARSTLGTHVAVIKGWYRWLAINGRIIADPTRRMKMRYVTQRIVTRAPLSWQEATAFVQTQFNVVDQAIPGTHTHAEAIRNLAMLCLGIATGRRVGGMTTLLVSDVDLVRNELRVSREKGHVGRVLPVAAWAMADAVARYLREARPILSRGHDVPWLFLNLSGNGPITTNAIRWVFAEMRKRTIQENADLADLPSKRISWHTLRVTFATELFGNGCEIRTVNELLLHRKLGTTARYTPIPDEDLRHVLLTGHPRP